MSEKVEYVYHARRYWVQTPNKNQHIGWNTNFEPCVVFKKTAKRIGILSPTLGILYLDRVKFECDGRVYHSKPHEYFYRVKPQLDPERSRFAVVDGETLKAFGVLELKYPASADEVKRAYKKQARKLHPDAGGSHESFLHLRKAFDVALTKIS